MLARYINATYCFFDGFVVLMGTDTMVYAASALSFMLQNLGKPVVFTGSQIPLREPCNDARKYLEEVDVELLIQLRLAFDLAYLMHQTRPSSRVQTTIFASSDTMTARCASSSTAVLLSGDAAPPQSTPPSSMRLTARKSVHWPGNRD